jgi:hypothetical protein
MDKMYGRREKIIYHSCVETPIESQRHLLSLWERVRLLADGTAVVLPWNSILRVLYSFPFVFAGHGGFILLNPVRVIYKKLRIYPELL